MPVLTSLSSSPARPTLFPPPLPPPPRNIATGTLSGFRVTVSTNYPPLAVVGRAGLLPAFTGQLISLPYAEKGMRSQVAKAGAVGKHATPCPANRHEVRWEQRDKYGPLTEEGTCRVARASLKHSLVLWSCWWDCVPITALSERNTFDLGAG